MDTKASIELIIYKFFSGSANEVEVEKLAGWLTESNENRLHYFALKRIWLENKEISDKERITNASWERLKLRTALQSNKRFKEDRTSYFNIGKLSVAATILILIGISSFLGIKLYNLSEFQKTTHEVTVPMGSRTNIVLPDGTNVWLNADSKLTHTSDFGHRNRNVSLSGEAYFDVSPHRSSVFTVKTRDMNIRALGTEFNVKSYPEEDVTEAILESGQIEVSVINDGVQSAPLLLSERQKLTYTRVDGIQIAPKEVDHQDIVTEILVPENEPSILPLRPSLEIAQIRNVDDYTSWKDGRLVFRAESLKELARKLERFYNVNISFENDSIMDIRYTGTLENVTIEEVLSAIATASNINYKIDKSKIIFNYN